MNKIRKGLTIFFAGVCLFCGPAYVCAENQSPDPCTALLAQLQDQNQKLSGDLRRIQRELAALRADLAKPGLKDIMAGIGYIVGLFGAAAFIASRRKG